MVEGQIGVYESPEVFHSLEEIIESGLPPLVRCRYNEDGEKTSVGIMTIAEAYAGWESACVRKLSKGKWAWY